MNCPLCRVELKVSERQGVEVDYCPKCRGVWLDRGELEKIIERSDAPINHDHDHDHDHDDAHYRSRPERRGGDGSQPPPPRKREGFFSRFFDFD